MHIQVPTKVLACLIATLGAAGTSAFSPRQLPLHGLSTQAISGHNLPITCLATHPTHPLALTADEAGSAILWHTAPLTSLGDLAGCLGGLDQLGVTAACWLPDGAHSGSDVVQGFLAVGTSSQIKLIGVSLQAGARQHLTLQLLVSTGIPVRCPTLQSLCTLHFDSDVSQPSSSVTKSQVQAATASHKSYLVGAVSQEQKVHNNQSEPPVQTHSQTAADAVVIWEVTIPSVTPDAKQGQGHMHQPQDQLQLTLLFCEQLASGSAEATCIMPSADAAFDLMVGTSTGSIQLLKTVLKAQKWELPTVKELKSPGRSLGRPIALFQCYIRKACCNWLEGSISLSAGQFLLIGIGTFHCMLHA